MSRKFALKMGDSRSFSPTSKKLRYVNLGDPDRCQPLAPTFSPQSVRDTAFKPRKI